MIQLKHKLTPELFKMFCISNKLNKKEKEMLNQILNDYSIFFHNGNFRYFDNYMLLKYGKSENKEKQVFCTNILIFVTCCGIDGKLFNEAKLFNYVDIASYIKINPTPSEKIKSELSKLLLTTSVNIDNDKDLQIFVNISYILELPMLPDSIKTKYMFQLTNNNQNLLNMNNCLVTFIKNLDYDNLECYFENKYNKIITLSKQKTNTKFNAKCYTIDQNNKKFIKENNLKEVIFSYKTNGE